MVDSFTASGSRKHSPSNYVNDSSTHVVVSTPVYWIWWWFVIGIHVAAGAFSMVQSIVHLVLSLPTVHLNTTSIPVSTSLERMSGFSYAIVMLLHAIAVVRILRISIGFRGVQLRFSNTSSRPTSSSTTPQIALIIRRVQATLFGPDGPFGINSVLFPMTLALREVVEVGLQSYQVWTLSYSVTSVRINSFAVGVVVLNCWSLPVVNLFFKHQEVRRRLMHLVVDMGLDFACAVVVPICVIAQYLVVFDWKAGQFPTSLMANDIWFANAVAEAKQTMVTSAMDYISSLLPQYSVFSCLRVVKRLVRRGPSSASGSSTIVPVPEMSMGSRSSLPSRLYQSQTHQLWERRFLRATSACTVLWGVVLLGIHISANTKSSRLENPGCQLYARTWLATNATCSVQYVHCRHLGITGSREEVGLALQGLEKSVVYSLTFLHCPALTISDHLVHFRRLGRLVIVNCTLVEWPMSATVKQSTHPVLTSVSVIGGNVSYIPDALLHTDLPHRFAYIAFLNCSLRALPDNIGEVWKSSGLVQLRFEGSPLHAVPRSLRLVPFRWLWLRNNQIEILPDDLFSIAEPASIKVSGSPLRQLPPLLANPGQLRELMVESTNVTSLPGWISSWLVTHSSSLSKGQVSLYGSPVCTSTMNSSNSQIEVACSVDRQSQYGAQTFEKLKTQYTN